MLTLDKSVLISSKNPQQNPSSKSGFSKRKVLLSTCVAVALGLIVNQSLSTQVKSDNNELEKSEFLQNLWMDQPQSNITWKKIPSLQVGQSPNNIIDLTVSPSGDIYGTVSKQMFGEEVKRGYLYSANSTNSSSWSKAFPNFQFEGIRFDKQGNFHLLDQNYNVFGKNNRNEIILNNIHDFQISSSNVFHAITENQMDTHFGNETSDINIRVYSASEYKKVQLLNDEPLLLTQNGSLSGYTNYHECLSDFSVGIDRSIWALNCMECSQLVMGLNSGIKGVKISAYDEISVAVLDVFGNISLSHFNEELISLPQLEQLLFSIISSEILDDAEKLAFVLGLLPQDHGYNEAVLCFRRFSPYDDDIFHRGCNNKGPTLVVGISIHKEIFGGYAQENWTSEKQSTCVDDKDAFIYSYDQKLKLTARPNSTCALKNQDLVGPKFGDTGDLMFSGSNILVGPADQYQIPNDASQEVREFWSRQNKFLVKTYEVFILKK
eukprot:403356918